GRPRDPAGARLGDVFTKQHCLLDVLFGLLLALAASAVFLAATAGDEGVRVGDFATARHYRVAIGEVLRAGVPPRQSELLRAHLWAPGYSASSAELAEAVGYGSWRTANFLYGALA